MTSPLILPKDDDSDGESYPSLEEIKELPRLKLQDLGGNVCIRGIQNSGKGILQVKFVNRLIWRYGYDWAEVYSNFHWWVKKPIFVINGVVKHGSPPPGARIIREGIPIPGYHYLDNEHMRKWVRKVYRKSRGLIRHIIIVIDEIDQVYSHLESMIDAEAREDLLTLFQDKKLEIFFIYTKHQGLGVNKIIRSATEISMKPYFDRRFDTLYGLVIDGFTMSKRVLVFRHASDAFPHYDRWEYIF
jgi:hypothetical protein